MDPISKKNFSFPNADRYREQATDSVFSNEQEAFSNETESTPRRTVNILDALAQSKKEDTGEAQNIRTYQSDIANTIKNDNVSMIKVALSEKKRQERRGTFDEALEQDNKNLYIVIGIIVTLLVLAGLTAGYIFLQNQNSKTQIKEEPQKVKPILYTEIISSLNLDEINLDDLTKIIEKDKEAVMELGDMKSIVFMVGRSTEERPITTEEFFRVLNTRAPEGLIRSLDSNYLLGVYAFNPRDMFAVFRVNSYDSAFAGMLEWEPNIESDIGDIFINKKDRINRDINSLSIQKALASSTASSTVLASTTPIESSPFGVLSQRKFIDKVLNNKDARVLVDSNGKESMLYTFLDKETLIISTSEKALKEIIFRLTTGRIVR